MALRLSLFSLFILFNITLVSGNNDSLLAIASRKETPDTTKAKIYGDLSFESRFSDADKAYSFALLSLKYASASGFDPFIAQAYNDLGIVYFDQAFYDSALICYEQAAKLRTALGDRKGLGAVYNKIGIVYQTQGVPEKALNFQIKSLKEYEAVGYDYGISYAMNNIAILYFNLNQTDMALNYYKKSLEIKLRIGDRDGVGGTLSNMANIYFDRKQYRIALNNYSEALQFIDTVKNAYYFSTTLHNIGRNYRKLGMVDSALFFIKKGLAIREASGDKKGQVTSLMALGSIYAYEQKRFQEGMANLKNALKLAEEIEAIRDRKDVMMEMAAVYKVYGDYRSAYDYLEAGKALSDSIFNQDLSQSIADLQVRYETERKEKENLKLLRENEVKDLEVARQEATINRMIFWTVFASLLAIVLVLVYLNWRNNKANREIQALEQKRFLDILQTEEKERSRIARELHDGISQLIASAKLHVSAIELEPGHSEMPFLETSRKLLDESLEEIRNISHDLMPGTLSRLGLAQAIRENARRIDASGSIAVECEVDEVEISDEIVGRSIYRIYQESVNNMLKYAEAKKINVSFKRTENGYFLSIKDNGKGFDTSSISQSTGLGWENIKVRSSLIGASFEISSKKGQGTHIRVNIPEVMVTEKAELVS